MRASWKAITSDVSVRPRDADLLASWMRLATRSIEQEERKIICFNCILINCVCVIRIEHNSLNNDWRNYCF